MDFDWVLINDDLNVHAHDAQNFIFIDCIEWLLFLLIKKCINLSKIISWKLVRLLSNSPLMFGGNLSFGVETRGFDKFFGSVWI
jgi:hypothetical protein